MRKLTVLVVLFASVLWLQAQDKGQASSATTLQGCLHYSKGHYSLVDSSGTKHRLSGAAQKLKKLVNHQISVEGKEGVHTHSTTEQGAASSVQETPVFNVSSVTDVAATCTAPTK
jgi:hypothetical protein